MERVVADPWMSALPAATRARKGYRRIVPQVSREPGHPASRLPSSVNAEPTFPQSSLWPSPVWTPPLPLPGARQQSPHLPLAPFQMLLYPATPWGLRATSVSPLCANPGHSPKQPCELCPTLQPVLCPSPQRPPNPGLSLAIQAFAVVPVSPPGKSHPPVKTHLLGVSSGRAESGRGTQRELRHVGCTCPHVLGRTVHTSVCPFPGSADQEYQVRPHRPQETFTGRPLNVPTRMVHRKKPRDPAAGHAVGAGWGPEEAS